MAAEHLDRIRVMLEGQEGHSYADILRVARTSETLGFGAIFWILAVTQFRWEEA